MPKTASIPNDLSFALAYPDYVDVAAFTTAGSTARDMPIPSWATKVFFSGDCNFAVRYNQGAAGTGAVYGAATSAGTTNGTGCEINPTVRQLPRNTRGSTDAPTYISVAAASTGYVSVAYYHSGTTSFSTVYTT